MANAEDVHENVNGLLRSHIAQLRLAHPIDLSAFNGGENLIPQPPPRCLRMNRGERRARSGDGIEAHEPAPRAVDVDHLGVEARHTDKVVRLLDQRDEFLPLLFRPFARCNVDRSAEHANRSVLGSQDKAVREYPDQLPVRSDQPKFQFIERVFSQGALDGACDIIPIRGVNQSKEAFRGRRELLPVHTKDRIERIRPAQTVAQDVPFPKPDFPGLRSQAQALFIPAQSFFDSEAYLRRLGEGRDEFVKFAHAARFCDDGLSLAQRDCCLLQRPHAGAEPTRDEPGQDEAHRDATGGPGQQQPARSPKGCIERTFARPHRDRPAVMGGGVGVDQVHAVAGNFFDDSFRCAEHRFAPPLARGSSSARSLGIDQASDEHALAIDNRREPVRRVVLLPQD